MRRGSRIVGQANVMNKIISTINRFVVIVFRNRPTLHPFLLSRDWQTQLPTNVEKLNFPVPFDNTTFWEMVESINYPDATGIDLAIGFATSGYYRGEWYKFDFPTQHVSWPRYQRYNYKTQLFPPALLICRALVRSLTRRVLYDYECCHTRHLVRALLVLNIALIFW